MRIIGGEARGRRLFAPEGRDTRPTADRTRESLFNILAPALSGARVLDLFGGTGALALEALSRGAAFAAICDVSPEAIRYIERNARLVLGSEDSARARVFRADYRKGIALLGGEPFSLVFLDPPYRMRDCYADAASRLLSRGLLSRDAILVMERAKDAPIALPDEFLVYDARAYRDTAIDFVRRREEI